MTPGAGLDPADGLRAETGPWPGDGRAETYLRLRAEAELRRALTLPRYDPPISDGMPGPLGLAARLARPAATAIAVAAGPVRPLGPRAADAVRPLADRAARTLHPLAENAARSLRPLTDDAARRLQPLAWRAAERLQALRYSRPHALMRWRWRMDRATATLRRTSADATPDHREPSAEEGLYRLRAVAGALVQVGAIDRATADSVLTGLETALAVRSRVDPHQLAMRELRATHNRQLARAPAGPYLAAPVGVTISARPPSGGGEAHLFTLVIAPDRAVLTAAGRLEPRRRPHQRHPWPLGPWPLGPWPLGPLSSGPGRPSATDDSGNSYQVDEDGGSSDSDGNWQCALSISPVPPAGTRWLDLTMGSDWPVIRVDLARQDGQDHGMAGPSPVASPAERLVDAAAEGLLQAAVGAGYGGRWHDLADIADIADLVTALDAVGALAPALGAAGRLVGLAARFGVEIPPALSAAAQPADLPAAWESVLENCDRKDGRCGVAAAAAVLPELDGARFVLAGLRSDAAGADLQVLAWGSRQPHHFFEEVPDQLWSWSARDDQGRWHVVSEGASSSDDRHTNVELRLAPALHPEATSLEVTLAGPSGQVSATVPLNWWEAT